MGVSTQFSLMPLLLVLFDAPLAVTQLPSNGLQMTAIDDLQYAYAPPSASNDWAMATGNESAVEGVLGQHMQNGGRLINTGYFHEPRTGRMRFYGIVHQFNGPVYLNPAPMNYSELTRQARENPARSLSLTRVCGQEEEPGKVSFTTYWENIPNVMYRLWFPGSTAADTQRTHYEQQGYRITHICGYTVQNRPQYVGIWQMPTLSQAPYEIQYGISLDECLAKDKQLTQQGYIAVKFQAFNSGNRVLCTAIWEQRPGCSHRIECDQDIAVMHKRILPDATMKPRQISHYIDPTDNCAKYVVLWSNIDTFRYPTPPDLWPLNAPIPNRYLKGSTEAFDPTKLRFLEKRIERFMRLGNIPGLSIAIAKDECLKFAAGYGYANVRMKECVDPSHKFRIGSISKPVTAAAIFLLVDQRKIRLDQKIFGPNSILGEQYGSKKPYQKYVCDITLRNLLEHTSGGWQNYKNDPFFMDAVFAQPLLDNDKLIGYVMDHFPLDEAPGKDWLYSNFGYLVLGKIIEYISGKPYEQFVKECIWTPSGVPDARIGGQYISEKLQKEVMYYMSGSSEGIDPYELLPMQRIAPWGGWVASPIDMLKFMVKVDGFKNKPDLLSEASTTSWSTPSLPSNDTYGMGWSLNLMGFNGWMHEGRMPGAVAMLIRLDSGVEIAVALNQEQGDRDFFNQLGFVIHHIVSLCQTWPQAGDLFCVQGSCT